MRILMVEDDPAISSAVREGLEDAGYDVYVCRDGERALRLVADPSFSLLMLDVMLPGLDGVELLRRLRAARVDTPVLMLTARDDVADRVLGLETGADDYLGKPFDFDELLARVRSLLRRQAAVKTSRIEIADLVVDRAGRTATRGGESLRLTAREYALLEALAANAGRVLSRETIQGRVWADEEAVSNVVDVAIRNLRKKVDVEGRERLIHTAHGLGYVLRREGEG